MSVTSDLLRGHTDTIILFLLSKGDSYGYEINNNIYKKSQGLLELKEATLYTAFKRLEKQELISSYWGDESEGGRRKYYSISDKGKGQLEILLKEWESCQKIINLIIGDEGYVQ